MNKILLVALVAVTLFMGCSKKNDSNPASASVVGKWYITTDSTKTYTNGTLTDHDYESGNHTDYVQFNSNLSGTQLSEGTLVNFTYVIKGNVLTLTYPKQVVDGFTSDAFSESGTYKATSSSLYVLFDDSETDGNVVTRTVETTYFTNK